MPRQHHFSGALGVGLALLLGGFVATTGFTQGVAPTDTIISKEMKAKEVARAQDARARDTKMADGYSVKLRAPDVVFQHQSVELAAVVENNQGQRVDGIPVEFRITPEWQADAAIVPDHVMVQDGVARTYFKADMPGRVMVTARVGNATDTETLVVDAQGSSISGNYRHYSPGEAPNSLVP